MALSADPEAVVQRQLEAYNARDIEALLATYADNAQLFEHPSKPLAIGTAALRERFVARFQEPNLCATVLHRAVLGNIVVDYEEVSRTFDDGPATIRLMMIYEVKGGKIARAWSIIGEKTPLV
jgi:hypothetical protein